MFGWRGRLLRINLTTGAVGTEELQPSAAREYLGGRGLGIYLHTKDVPGSAEPLGADNNLVFITGPLTGTLAPNGGRYTVVTRSPFSGSITACSMSGKWGPELKFAGFDGIVVEGRAANPVYLWVTDGKAELRSAAHVAGKKVDATIELLLRETSARAAISCIGPAGENGVAGAVIATDSFSAAGKTGAAAVMGFKNLKAIVVSGSQGFRLANYPEFLKSSTALRSVMKSKAIAARGSQEYGIVLNVDSLTWEAVTGSGPARTRGCFGCATSFSSFVSAEANGILPLAAGDPPGEMADRLKEYRLFVDLGLDFASAKSGLASPGGELDVKELARKLASGATGQFTSDKAQVTSCMDRGPCMAAGYAVFPRIPSDGRNGTSVLMAVLDSVGLCPFLCTGVAMETVAELIAAATGAAFTQQELHHAGERICRL